MHQKIVKFVGHKNQLITPHSIISSRLHLLHIINQGVCGFIYDKTTRMGYYIYILGQASSSSVGFTSKLAGQMQNLISFLSWKLCISYPSLRIEIPDLQRCYFWSFLVPEFPDCCCPCFPTGLLLLIGEVLAD